MNIMDYAAQTEGRIAAVQARIGKLLGPKGAPPQQEEPLKTVNPGDRAANVRARVAWLLDSDRSEPCPEALTSEARRVR